MNEKFCPRCFKKFADESVLCPECKIRLVAALDRDLVGEVLDDRYEVLGRLGKGGMGVVYRARQKIIDRPVALKVLRRELAQDEAAVKRFLVEAKAVSSLASPHIVTLYDFGITHEGLLYFTMEMMEGEALTALIKREAPLGAERAAKILLQACSALAEAHGKGILHRDLKPDNIFILKDDHGGELVKMLDFGIAKIMDDGTSESITRTGMVCGTPMYLSPEQAMGRSLDARSDIYSLGIILYEMLSGSPPFVDQTPVAVLMKQVSEQPKSVHVIRPDVEIPVALDELLMAVLAKNPEHRPQSVEELKQRLAAALDASQSAPGATVRVPGLETSSTGFRMPVAGGQRPGKGANGAGEGKGGAGQVGMTAASTASKMKTLESTVTEEVLDTRQQAALVGPVWKRKGLWAAVIGLCVLSAGAAVMFGSGSGGEKGGSGKQGTVQETKQEPAKAAQEPAGATAGAQGAGTPPTGAGDTAGATAGTQGAGAPPTGAGDTAGATAGAQGAETPPTGAGETAGATAGTQGAETPPTGAGETAAATAGAQGAGTPPTGAGETAAATAGAQGAGTPPTEKAKQGSGAKTPTKDGKKGSSKDSKSGKTRTDGEKKDPEKKKKEEIDFEPI
jgi:serine/threonine-protein kinase